MFKGNNGILMKQQDLFVQVQVPFICNPDISDSEKVLYLYFWIYGISDKRGLEVIKKLYPNKIDTNATKY